MHHIEARTAALEFFVESRDIGDIAVLTKLAGEIGLNVTEFEEVVKSREYREAHEKAPRHVTIPVFIQPGA